MLCSSYIREGSQVAGRVHNNLQGSWSRTGNLDDVLVVAEKRLSSRDEWPEMLSFATTTAKYGILVFFCQRCVVAFVFLRFVKLLKWNKKNIYLGKFSSREMTGNGWHYGECREWRGSFGVRSIPIANLQSSHLEVSKRLKMFSRIILNYW